MSSASKQWRLLFVANVPWAFAMHRLPIALMARERGAEVHVACGEGEGADDIVSLGFPFHPLPLTRNTMAPIRDLRAIRALTRLYRQLQPDVVHHVTLKPVVYGSIAARLARVPAVVNAFAGLGYVFSSGSLIGWLRRGALLRLLERALRLPRQAVVFENDDDRRLLIEAGAVPSELASVIAGVGVDTTEYYPTVEPGGPVRIVLASRMIREKGVEYFVEAARRLKVDGAHARFVLVGTPDPFNPSSLSENQLRSWDSEGIVEWQGFRRDMPRVLQEAHVVCLPTYYREGVPRILIEAAASGRPLVATDMPGCRDIVQNGVNGFTVPAHDVERLTAALKLLIDDRDLRTRLGLASRTIVEKEFALPRVLDQFWQIYSTLRVPVPQLR
jgi:glycosyltransferase involved in cell wall biosynthesis